MSKSTEEQINRLSTLTQTLAQQIKQQYDTFQEILARQKVRDNTHRIFNVDMTITRTNAPLGVRKIFNGIPPHSMKFISISGTFQYYINEPGDTLLTASAGDTIVDEDIYEVYATTPASGSGNTVIRFGTWAYKAI